MLAILRRVSVLAACVAAFATFGVTPAHADLAVERPVMYFTFTYTSSTETVCGVGVLREPPASSPTWTLNLVGLNSNGSLINIEGSSFVQDGSVCRTVNKASAQYGTYVATYRYVAPLDPPSAIVGHVLWTPTSDTMIATGQ